MSRIVRQAITQLEGIFRDILGGQDSCEENGTSARMQAFWLMLYGALRRNDT